MTKLTALTAAAFLGCILAANYVTTEYGMIPVGFGLMATAGTYLAGLTFVLRDTLQDAVGKWAVMGLIVLGAVLSYAVSTTEWKLGEAAREIVAEAKARGKWVHMGRVNSERRFEYARAIGCDSVDGTYLTFGPDTNLPKLLAWTRNNGQGGLF